MDPSWATDRRVSRCRTKSPVKSVAPSPQRTPDRRRSHTLQVARWRCVFVHIFFSGTLRVLKNHTIHALTLNIKKTNIAKCTIHGSDGYIYILFLVIGRTSETLLVSPCITRIHPYPWILFKQSKQLHVESILDTSSTAWYTNYTHTHTLFHSFYGISLKAFPYVKPERFCRASKVMSL